MTPILTQRFWNKVDERPDGCWIWTGAVNSSGYGCVSIHKRVWLVHRAVHTAINGPIPDGYHVDHLCRVRLCVNPEHLEAVTPAENNRRMLDAVLVHNGPFRRRESVTHVYRDRWGRHESTHAKKGRIAKSCPRCQANRAA